MASPEKPENDEVDREMRAKRMLKQVAREERLLDQAEGQVWLEFIPLICLAIAVLLGVCGVVTVDGWVVVVLIILQLSLWGLGRRLDAIITLLKSRED